jgi:serine protease AprX
MFKNGTRGRAGFFVAAIAALVVLGAPSRMVHSQGRSHRAHLSADLEARLLLHRTPSSNRVIVRGTRAAIDVLAARHDIRVVRWLGTGAVVTADNSALESLAGDPDVDTLSGDVPVRPFMSVSNASTQANKVRAGTWGLLGLGAIAGVNGSGITVAVVDSGISPHAALSKKVIANVSFVTGDPSTVDTFGHGTHIAGIIAGQGGPASYVTPLYNGGIAPGAQLVNVRVLGDEGTGYTSDVIAGIDWVIANASTYKIRVINLSLGHPVTEPAETDPLCDAEQRAVSAGLVVVASAGNAGKTADGHEILGGITSPGNSPYAITVGAINTHGTVDRSDDTVDTFSSRGPTRFDLAVKPDLGAPGNKIVSLEASKSYLSSSYSWLHVAGTGTNAYMELSGTSMAAAMVSGAAALLLDAAPGMSPAQMKIALQAGSSYMRDGGLMGAGAGSANFWNSRQGQASLLSTLLGLLGLGGSSASGATYWDGGTMTSRLYAGTGIRLLSTVLAPLAFLNPSLLNWGDLNLLGLGNPLAAIAPNPLIWGSVASWNNVSRSNQILWGDTIYDPQGEQILWGDSSTTEDNQILWGDSVIGGDQP